MDKLSFAFLGATNYSKELLLFLINKRLIPKAIFSIPEEFNISYSEKKVKNTNYANLKDIANEYDIPYYEIDSVEGKKIKSYEQIIKKLNLDLILVLGWYYVIPQSIRELVKYGAWGIHASLLPKYAGGAPLSWAIINGEKETGITLFRMENGVDDGDIISQKSFSIEFVKAKLVNNDANIYKYMDKPSTQKLINEHLSGKKNRRLFIWSLLNFEEWNDIYG